MTIVNKLLLIQSDDSEVIQKGHILQILILLLMLVRISLALTGTAEAALEPIIQQRSLTTTIIVTTQIIGNVLLTVVSLFLIHRGQVRPATHLNFGLQSFGFAAILLLGGGTDALAYLMLVSIIAVAILDQPNISLIYATLTIGVVYLYAWRLTEEPLSRFFAGYTISTITISLTVWLTANNLQTALREAKRLARDLQENSRHLQATNQMVEKRARQLQTAAETSQITVSRLSLPLILEETVKLIQEQFGYYFVAIYMFDQQQNALLLQEAVGDIGQQLKAERFKLKLDTNSIICWSATQRKVRVSHDVSQDPVYLMHTALEKTRSELALPLVARGDLIGILDIQSIESHAFQEEDVAILQILASQAAINIDNVQLFAQTETRLSEMESLYTLNTLLTTTLDVGEIYRRAAISFAEQLEITHCTIYSWEAEHKTITVQIDFTSDPTSGKTGVYNLQHTIYQLKSNSHTQRVLHTLEPLLHHLHDPALSASKRERLIKLQQVFCLEIPLVRGVEAIGLVELFHADEQHRFNQTEIQFAQTIASQVANALHNAMTASESRARVAQLSTLNRISHILSLSPSLKDIFDGARREIMSLVEATGMSIMLLDKDENKIRWVYGYEYGQEVDLSSFPLLSIEKGFSGYVVRNREMLHINQRMAEMHQELQSTTIGAFPSSWLGLPLIVANELIGVLVVENEHDSDAFLERDIELLQTISGPLAITINNLIQFEAVQTALAAQSEQRLQLQTAAEVAAAATSILDQETLMNRAVTLIKERFALYYVGLFLIDQDTKTAVLKAGTGEAGRIQIEREHHLQVGGHSLIGGVTKDGQNRITQDVYHDREWQPNPILPDTKSELALPLKVRSRIIGALTAQSTQTYAFNNELIGILQTLSDQLAVAIENAQLLTKAEAKARQQQRLNEISTHLYRSGDVSEIIRTGLQAISEELKGATVDLHLGILLEDGQEKR